MPTGTPDNKKGHVVPKSDAKHPRDRWETLFVYQFILKFTHLRGKVQGLESPMDIEDALLSRGPNDILQQILTQFVLNLRPQTRNLSPDMISSTVSSLLSEYFKTSERTVFWNDQLHRNVDPFDGVDGGFFSANWDLKLEILRQLVELQLCHAPEIKSTIDRAWGVQHNKQKKKDTSVPPDPNGMYTRENLTFSPFGQDCTRKRYWIADSSPRIYVSTNPWKTSATFVSRASTRDEYLATISELKTSAPPQVKRMLKQDAAHHKLMQELENRIEIIDNELTRVQKVRRKMEQKQILLAQAELRETRTRRQTRRPDYTYNDSDVEDDAGGDDYMFQEEEDETFIGDEFEDDMGSTSGRRPRRAVAVAAAGTRRSARNNNKRSAPPDEWNGWKGERRSTRLGAPPETQFDEDPRRKRARTEDSTISSGSRMSEEAASVKQKSSAAAVKANEIAVDQVAGKKKSKFWFYAVEPERGHDPAPSHSSEATVVGVENGNMKIEESDGDHPMNGNNEPNYEDSLVSEGGNMEQ